MSAILAPKEIFFLVDDASMAAHIVDRTFCGRVWRSVLSGVVQHCMLVLAYQLVGSPSRQARGGGIDERCYSGRIQAKNALCHRFENSAIEIVEGEFRRVW